MDWTWAHSAGEWPTFMTWQEGWVKHSQSNQYMEVQAYSGIPIDEYGEAVVKIKSDSKGVEITTTIRTIGM